MKKRTQALCAVLTLGLALLAAGVFLANGSKDIHDFADLQAFRAHLREQVAGGDMSMAEAQVRLAEALAELKPKGKSKKSRELEAWGKKLEEQVKSGELTTEEAKAKWIEAGERAGAKGSREGMKRPAAKGGDLAEPKDR